MLSSRWSYHFPFFTFSNIFNECCQVTLIAGEHVGTSAAPVKLEMLKYANREKNA